MYFQIPLMVLVILPALEGLRPAWREAAQNMGAGTWQYWRYVGGPVLLPVVPRLPAAAVRQRLRRLRHRRGADRRHDRADPDPDRRAAERQRLAGQQNLGYALGLIMVVIIAIVMIIYAILQRRAARWLR